MTTRANRPRGRAVLLSAFAIFGCVQLTASVLFDYRWPQVRYPHYYEVISRYSATDTSPNVLFLGSSRTMCLLDETRVTALLRAQTGDETVQCFNAGVATADPLVQERVLRDLIRRGARPRYAVIELCPEGVNQRIGWLFAYAVQFLRWDDTPAYLKDLVVTNNALRFAGTRFVPLYVYRDQIRQRLSARAGRWYAARLTDAVASNISDIAPTDIVAWQKSVDAKLREQHVDPRTATSSDMEVVRRFVRDYRPGGNAAAGLERLLALCRAHDIEPILVGVPLSSAHRSIYTPPVESAFQAYVADIEQKHGCRYVDYRAALPDAQFLDHHHATVEGGTAFSQRLTAEVLAPMWMKAPVCKQCAE